jgi:hypothetical protein
MLARRLLYALALMAALLIAACSSGDNDTQSPAPAPTAPPEPFTCALGMLTGSWRVVYTETSGTCGRVADEVATVPSPPPPGADAGAPASNGCTFAAATISEDKCSIDTDFTCPIAGTPNATQRWNGTLRQTGAQVLAGTWGLQVTGPLGTCRSVYSVRWTRL